MKVQRVSALVQHHRKNLTARNRRGYVMLKTQHHFNSQADYMLCVHTFSPLLCCVYYRSSVVHMEYKGCIGRPYQTWTTDHSHHPFPCHFQLGEKEGTSWRSTAKGKWYLWNTQLSLFPLSIYFAFHDVFFFFLTLLEASSFLPFTLGF